MTQLKLVFARTALQRIALVAFAAGLTTCATAQTTPAAAPAAASTAAAPTQTPPFNGIAHIAIRVKDIAASVAFYNKLGYEQAFANTSADGTVTQSFLKLDDKQFIELYPAVGRDTQIGFMHLCFEGADLNGIHDYYVAEGLAPISVRTAAAGNLLFTLKGPEQPAFPQNIEYTQYMPDSRHSRVAGLHLDSERVADHMAIVSLAMKDPDAAREFYLTKLGFTANPATPARLNLPGDSGQQVELVPANPLGLRSSIIMTTPSLEKAAALLTRENVAFELIPAVEKGLWPSKELLRVTDPDDNLLRIVQAN
jgi:catechol 2,3-dioxygenase-like lactoylglutathione lyase family enzyme